MSRSRASRTCFVRAPTPSERASPPIPDGEVGQRKYWTFYLPTRTYSVHPDLEAVNAPPDGQVRQPTAGASQKEWNESWWTFKLRPGVSHLTFESLHYVEEATRSYEIFRRLRADGVIPVDARFQVSFPGHWLGGHGLFRATGGLADRL